MDTFILYMISRSSIQHNIYMPRLLVKSGIKELKRSYFVQQDKISICFCHCLYLCTHCMHKQNEMFVHAYTLYEIAFYLHNN